MSSFAESWSQHIADVPKTCSGLHYNESAARLRVLLKSGVLRLTDIKNNPEHFFEAHDLLSQYATTVGPGFGIRFTVQYNLFAGTIMALGNPDQVAALDTMQAEGVLGCFCLTERLAGVSSGLAVDTTCEWDDSRQMFLLNCPDEGAKKNWISQGLTADKAVVVATLFVKSKSYGPHAFVMDLRKNGELVPGVTAEDMGDKTIGNDLDNARINFSNVWLPKTALLDRYGGIEAGDYVQHKPGTANIDMIGQRLYTGRAVIASSTLFFARNLYARTREYTDNKKCWQPKGTLMLSDVPQLSTLFEEADHELRRVEALRDLVAKRLSECLRADVLPDSKLVEMVTVLKVKAIETSIALCFRLKQELGSYALMGGTGFEKMDYLQCCKFAEGDSRILMQKLARDRLMEFKDNQTGSQQEAAICTELVMALMAGGKKALNEKWKLVYKLADTVIERVVDEVAAPSKL